MRRMLTVLSIVLCAAVPLRAQEESVRREGRAFVRDIEGRLAEPVSRLRVATDFGNVAVEAGVSAAPEYRVRLRVLGGDEAAARQALGRLRIAGLRGSDGWTLTGRAASEGSPEGISAEFVLTVPRGTEVIDVATGAGDIRARGLGGRIMLATRAGNIVADEIDGPLTARTRGGGIMVGAVRGDARLVTAGGNVTVGSVTGEVVAQTSGGDVRVERVSGHLRAETGGGNIDVASAGGDVDVQTGGGGIVLGRVTGQVSAASAGGGIRVGGAGNGVRCETAAGPITLLGIAGPVRAVTSAGSIRADFLPAGGTFFDSDIQTWQGDVTITLPPTLPLTIHAVIDNASRHGIRSEFPLSIVREAVDAGRPVEVGDGVVAGGGAILKIRTLGGSISILKSKEESR